MAVWEEKKARRPDGRLRPGAAPNSAMWTRRGSHTSSDLEEQGVKHPGPEFHAALQTHGGSVLAETD